MHKLTVLVGLIVSVPSVAAAQSRVVVGRRGGDPSVRRDGGRHGPSVRVRAPGFSVRTPSVRFRTPSVRFRTPSVRFRTPSVRFRTPSVGVRVPGISVRTPSVGFHTPGISVRTPSVGFHTPGISVRTPGVRVSVGHSNHSHSRPAPTYTNPTVRCDTRPQRTVTTVARPPAQWDTRADHWEARDDVGLQGWHPRPRAGTTTVTTVIDDGPPTTTTRARSLPRATPITRVYVAEPIYPGRQATPVHQVGTGRTQQPPRAIPTGRVDPWAARPRAPARSPSQRAQHAATALHAAFQAQDWETVRRYGARLASRELDPALVQQAFWAQFPSPTLVREAHEGLTRHCQDRSSVLSLRLVLGHHTQAPSGS